MIKNLLMMRGWSILHGKGLAIITENNIDGLFNDKAIQSATKNGYIKEFTTHITDDDTFDFFEDIERKLIEPEYMEIGRKKMKQTYYFMMTYKWLKTLMLKMIIIRNYQQ